MSRATALMALLAVVSTTACDSLRDIPTPFSLLPDNGYSIRRPANLPPAGYKGEFWVDRRGCEYIRTQDGNWSPRFGNNGRAVCHDDLEGVTAGASAPRALGPQPGDIVSIDESTGIVTRVAAPQIIPPSYVNVATFSRTQNGIAARTAFADMGFPIVGVSSRAPIGKPISVVLGPFTERDALDDALQVALSLGYENATTFSN